MPKILKFINHTSIVALAVAFVTLLNASPVLAAAHPPNVRLRHGTSSNWSGYASYGSAGTFNSVSASWIQPQVTCTSTNTYSSYWVGLDGYNTSTVEQLGTEADCSSGSPSYYAWYEMYPKRGYYIRMSVHAGDTFNASVNYSGNKYVLSLTNTKTNQSFTTTQKFGSGSRASAEVIVEAPWSGGTLPLANFGTVGFTNATANGQPMSNFALDPITMLNPYGMTAAPSTYDTTNKSFSVTYSN